MDIWSGLNCATAENVWQGTDLFQVPKQWRWWFMSQGDSFHHHSTPQLLLMKRAVLENLTHCARIFRCPHAEHDEKNTDNTLTTFFKLREQSMCRFFPSFIFIDGFIKKLWRPSEGLLMCCRGGFRFREGLNVSHNSHSSHPAVVSFSFPFFFTCLECYFVIGFDCAGR